MLTENVCKITYMLSDRVKTARKAKKFTQQKLADEIGISRNSVTMWETAATKKIEGENLVLAAKALDVSAIWLATGKGPMHPPRQGSIEIAQDDNVASTQLSAEDIENRRLLDSLSDEEMQDVIKYAKFMKEQRKP